VGRVGVTGRFVVQGRVPTALRRGGGALGTDARQRQRTKVKISSACVAIAPVGARTFRFEQALPLVVPTHGSISCLPPSVSGPTAALTTRLLCVLIGGVFVPSLQRQRCFTRRGPD